MANLLHRLNETLFEADFTDTDFGFLNHAVPRFFQQIGETADTNLVAMLVQLHDMVPEEQRSRLTWHPSEQHRRMAMARLT